jgi:D-lactate dehydrogenase (cytochrome)
MHTIRARDPRGGPAAAAVDRSPDAIGGYLEDAAHFTGGHADAIARPVTEADLSALVAEARRVLPIGAQSSVTGGATPDGGLILSTSRLTAIQESGQDRIRVGAGVPLETLQKLLRERGRWYAPVPTFAGAFVGGVVATNAAGAATYKYGPTRPWVDGLTVVLSCGHVLDVVRGEVHADPRDGFEIACAHGTRRVKPGAYRMPAVPKCSAGYFAAPDMDLIDLFIGSEGTLGIVADATLRLLPVPPAVAMALVPVASEAAALTLVAELRRLSTRTWQERDPRGIDVAAIEYVDRRCLDIMREDHADRTLDIAVPADAELMLIVQLELPIAMDAAAAYDEIANALSPIAPDSPLVRFCRTLERHGVIENAELAMPGDDRRAQQFLAFREAAPTGVNRRVGEAKRLVDGRIEKTAADMIAPFDAIAEMLEIYRNGYRQRGLDFAIWGHISDGNVHPNVIPHSYDDMQAGREAILEFGRDIARLGGCPLAEHGVGRSSLKQALLRQLYGDRGVNEMRAIKQALDPDWKLAPGVIFPGPWALGPGPKA